MNKAKHPFLSIGSWCLYDAANSAFATVIITFIFGVYFARGVVGDEIAGSALWGYAIAASGLLIAIASPILGAVADHYGARKPWLVAFSALCIVATCLMYFAVPSAGVGTIAFVLALLVIANTAFEIALVYANAMLPGLAPPAMMGRISGWAWGMGYVGGLLCLVLALVLLVGLGDIKPILPLAQDQSQHLRATAPLVALWFALLSLPLLFFTPDEPRTGLSITQSVKTGLGQLMETLRHVRTEKNLFLFLISSALYRDGLNTLFAVGGLYAAGTFQMNFTEILIFAIGLNVTAGIGAALFSFLDDKIGSKPTIMLALGGLVISSVVILCLHDKNLFILMALVLGIFIGPAQAASRTMAARLSPPDRVTQTFGLYSLTGKSVSFLGPLLFALATSIFHTQRAGLVTIILLWLVGMALLSRVKEEKAA